MFINKKFLFLSVMISTLLFSGCKPSMEKEVAYYLKLKYGEDFFVTSSGYSTVLKVYSYRAYLKTNPHIKIQGEHSEDFSYFTDSYQRVYLSRAFTRRLEKELEASKGDLFLRGEMHATEFINNSPFDINSLDLDDRISNSESTMFTIDCYMAGSLSDKLTESRLKILYAYMKRFYSLNKSYFTLNLYILKPDFFKQFSPLLLQEYMDRRYEIYKGKKKIEQTLNNNSSKKFGLIFNTHDPFKHISYDEFYAYIEIGGYERYPLNLNNLMDVLDYRSGLDKLNTLQLDFYDDNSKKKKSIKIERTDRTKSFWYRNNKRLSFIYLNRFFNKVDKLEAIGFLEKLPATAKHPWVVTLSGKRVYRLWIYPHEKKNGGYVCESNYADEPFILDKESVDIILGMFFIK